MATVFLTDFDDDYEFTADDEAVIYAGKGNDSVRGGLLDDIIYGYEGDDFLSGLLNEDLLYGDSGNDILDGGSANDILYGGAGNDILDGGSGLDTMSGGQGNDVYFTDDAFETIIEELGQGVDTVYAFSSVELSANVENLFALGARAISLFGNGLANHIVGNDAPNVIDGGFGADRMEGKRGNDIYYVDSVGDVVVELAGQGTDTARATISYALAVNVENLELLGTASLTGTGNTLANRITGNQGANALNGGLGADVMVGGGGNDIYTVDNAGDLIEESPALGIDTVNASVTYTLAADVENLNLTGLAAINGTGNNVINRITGNGAANILDGKANADVMIGGLGADTYFVDRPDDTIMESGVDVDTVNSTAAFYFLPSFVENLNVLVDEGQGRGNALRNKLSGAAGKQYLDGGLGADDMRGGLGNDTYYVDNVGDVVVELAGQGIDEVQSTITYTLGANVELLELEGVLAINGTGNTVANFIGGNNAANVLNGGLGADRMAGRAGNDVYFVDNVADAVIEADGQGLDTVNASVSFTLSDFIENLNLTGAALLGTGNASINRIVGNALANTLNGGAENDILTGGLGNDTYIVDSAKDVIVELAGQGTDTVNSSATSYTLAANVENLNLTGFASTGVGNVLANRIVGNSGRNLLDGGLGADYMAGGDGSDSYIVDNVGDVVFEFANQGAEHVQSTISYVLGANVEDLSLGGAAAINGTGNALTNVIIGNIAANILNGGAGADDMRGGGGNDTYFVDNAGDTVFENAGQGTDTVNSSVGFSLSSNVENLNLTGTAAVNGFGNALNNKIVGNGAANLLGGILGVDTLTGGLGADAFFFQLLGGVATITDFAPATEAMLISRAGFGSVLTLGAPIVFVSGSTPASTFAGPTVLYDTDDGRILFDSDGIGAAVAVHFATLTGAPLITAADFIVVP